MNKTMHYIGLDVQKETIAVSIARQRSTEVRRCGIIGGTLDAVDKLLKKLSPEGVEMRVVYEAEKGSQGVFIMSTFGRTSAAGGVVVNNKTPFRTPRRPGCCRRRQS